MKGMNAVTGRAISGLEHLAQSVGRIIGTPLASCIQRREFGSEVPDLIDAPTNGETRVRLYAAVATALIRWEPRIVVTRVRLVVDAENAYAGRQYIDVEGWTDERTEPVTVRVPASSGAAR
ncbi:GPW/gp25 family protein [Burkholderia diffusa]|uniref:GPW/gp25 family protein n=1 Tax=Burkholderia diffusa TaxID=488732 RepID=UPI001FC81DD4|nr:GPW/gp25 family protein [Burkholderia diffusa]